MPALGPLEVAVILFGVYPTIWWLRVKSVRKILKIRKTFSVSDFPFRCFQETKEQVRLCPHKNRERADSQVVFSPCWYPPESGERHHYENLWTEAVNHRHVEGADRVVAAKRRKAESKKFSCQRQHYRFDLPLLCFLLLRFFPFPFRFIWFCCCVFFVFFVFFRCCVFVSFCVFRCFRCSVVAFFVFLLFSLCLYCILFGFLLCLLLRDFVYGVGLFSVYLC